MTQPRVQAVTFSNETFSVALQDGKSVSAPLEWYPRLSHATAKEKSDWHVIRDSDDRDIIFWESLDEFIPVIALLTGTPSRESQRSFENWLAARHPSK